MSAITRSPVDIAAKRAEITNAIDQLYDELQRQQECNDLQQEQRVQRNILLVGSSKSGKTTLRHVLVDPRHVAEELSLRSSSETVSRYEQNVRPLSSRVTLNIVELPANMISPTSDLSEINAECARLNAQDFHLIVFCVSFAAGIDGTAVQSFTRLISHLGGEKVSRHLCLIITRCESKNEAQREALRDELIKDVMFAGITRYFGRGIYFSGALNHDDWNRASEALYYQFDTIFDYRKKLLNLIASGIEPFHIQPKTRPSHSEARNVRIDASKPPDVPLVQPRVPQPVQTQPQSTTRYVAPASLAPNADTTLLRSETRSESCWTRCRRAYVAYFSFIITSLG